MVRTGYGTPDPITVPRSVTGARFSEAGVFLFGAVKIVKTRELMASRGCSLEAAFRDFRWGGTLFRHAAFPKNTFLPAWLGKDITRL